MVFRKRTSGKVTSKNKVWKGNAHLTSRNQINLFII